MVTAKNTTQISKEEIKMRKYIVEAPEPKKCQKVSSGGIRENGKLVSQFKNPIPYEEPTFPPAVTTQSSHVSLIRQEQIMTRRNETRMYFLNLVWQELGEPLLRSGLRKLGNTIINKIESPVNTHTQYISSPEPKVIDIEADEIKTVYDGKIIRFPNGKVI